MAGRFRAQVSAAECERAKPHPAPYLEVLVVVAARAATARGALRAC